ncbi:lysophospholipid acyltransferase family protein [Demequina oxidasica]|uniref:lysophospholipid acyltransferase family protein n=1 Tax=Demequina oxidasica TaxID=676199 RepID=UPI0007801BF4|nr:lysophospholipid acyltransferase family protein [Demequina oxidasica]
MATGITRCYRAVACVLRPIVSAMTRKDWHGKENLPRDTGFIAVSNHVSYADPITFAHFLYNNGHPPRFLAKSSLFDIPIAGRLLRNLDQIPVYRGTKRARDALDMGATVLDRGDMIAVFPEGTLTKDPQMWPMVARTGAARMALEQNVPVIPVAQWGADKLLSPYSKTLKPFPRKTITVIAGPPVDLDEFRGQPIDSVLLRAATNKIMATLTSMLEDIRGESAPAEPFNMRDRKRDQ